MALVGVRAHFLFKMAKRDDRRGTILPKILNTMCLKQSNLHYSTNNHKFCYLQML